MTRAKIVRLPVVAAVAVGLAAGIGISTLTDGDEQAPLAAPAVALSTEAGPSTAGGQIQQVLPPILDGDPGTFGRIPDVVEAVQPTVTSILVRLSEGGAEGSGVIWDGSRGLVITNNHVVQDAVEVTVVLMDGERIDAEVLATDPTTDLALLTVDRTDLPTARLATELPRVGELAVALGNPLGFDNSVTAGIVSGLHRTVPAGGLPLVDLVQTDAPISPGNSGGALANQNGEVIGINVAAIPPTPDTRAVSIGFAIPSPTVSNVVQQLLENGEARHAFLGIQPANLTPEVADEFGIQAEQGVVVAGLVTGGAAERFGLLVGDVIVAFDGEPLRIVEDLFASLRQYRPGDSVELAIDRDGDEIVIETVLADQTGQ